MKSEIRNLFDLSQAGYARKWVIISILIGSGGSGGVLWNVLHSFPAITPDSPSTFVIVGMMALFDAMNKMVVNDIGQLPVVERDTPERLVGVLAVDDVTRLMSGINN